MSSLRLVLATFGGTLLLLGWGTGLWAPASPASAAAIDPLSTSVSDIVADDERSDVEREHRLIDRYGNELERAVTDYRIDARGDVYERHSPQTALPEPAPPST